MPGSYLIIGGAGFIGTNAAAHYLSKQKQVTIFDNFSRPGSEKNAAWLQQRFGDRLTVVEGDIRQPGLELQRLASRADVVLHLAAQVAVTTSVTDPRHDFEVNALGTFNVLEAVRACAAPPILIYASTNKVYGNMADLGVIRSGRRYRYRDCPNGIPESRPLDFYSPYGCSKGCGDQYVLDYARIYGLKTVVMRQSCIYGPHQFGVEDQGWVAWFAIRALQRLPVTVFGDGRQVRDVLYVDDLIDAYDRAVARIAKTAGRAYNIGGGPQNTLSLLELIETLDRHFGFELSYSFEDWRPGDQKVFVSDVSRAAADFGWAPQTNVSMGVSRLLAWLSENERQFQTAMAVAV